MTFRMGSFLLGALATLLLSLATGLIVVLTGGYDVAATERHTALGAWAIHTNFDNSVRRAAGNVAEPELTPALVAAGAGEYKAMCAHCHGGVGERRAEWVEGMRPKPPALARAAGDWRPREVFWLVKHGARMTGMPAFGESHDDRTIWNIAAFVKALPTMTAQQYAAYPAEHGEEHDHSHAMGEGHEHSHAEGEKHHHEG